MPEHSPVVVVNATPLIELSLVGRLDLLQALYGRIIIPPAVRQEVFAGKARAPGVDEVGGADWIVIRRLQYPAGQGSFRIWIAAKRKSWRWHWN